MPRSWPDKFKSAFRGIWLAVRSERSFAIHLPVAVAVGVVAAIVGLSLAEACDERPGIAAALDMASGAVLVCSLGAAAIGVAIFAYRLSLRLGWWA
jgi:diacylglycerol kinase